MNVIFIDADHARRSPTLRELMVRHRRDGALVVVVGESAEGLAADAFILGNSGSLPAGWRDRAIEGFCDRFALDPTAL
jgi:hypothetical protein